jgi:hypothetical protein
MHQRLHLPPSQPIGIQFLLVKLAISAAPGTNSMKLKAISSPTICLAAILGLVLSCGEPHLSNDEVGVGEAFKSSTPISPLVGVKGKGSGPDKAGSTGVAGNILCYYSDQLVTGFRASADDSNATTRLDWSVKERVDLDEIFFFETSWVFTTSFSMKSIKGILGDRIAVLGIDSKNRTVIEAWHMEPAKGGFAAGSWAYPPLSVGFSAEFTSPTKVKGGGAFIEPNKRKGAVVAKRIEVLREDLGMEPLSIAAYPDGETFFVLLRSFASGFSKIVKVSAPQSGPVVVTDIATSTTYPSMEVHEVLQVRAFLFAEHGYLVTLSGGYETDQTGAMTENIEKLTFEDFDGDGAFENVVNFVDEMELLTAYEGQMITKKGSLYR